MNRHGAPIRYGYVPDVFGLEAYQTVFAARPRQRRNALGGPPLQPRAGERLRARRRRVSRPSRCTRE